MYADVCNALVPKSIFKRIAAITYVSMHVCVHAIAYVTIMIFLHKYMYVYTLTKHIYIREIMPFAAGREDTRPDARQIHDVCSYVYMYLHMLYTKTTTH